MRYVDAFLGQVFTRGEQQYALLSFEEHIPTAQLAGGVFRNGAHRYTVPITGMDFDARVLQEDPVLAEDPLLKSYYLGKKVRTQSGRYFGNVVDLGFEDAGGRILEFVTAKTLFGVRYERRHITRAAVVHVSKRLIIVEDATVRDMLREKGRFARFASRPVSACMRWIIRQP